MPNPHIDLLNFAQSTSQAALQAMDVNIKDQDERNQFDAGLQLRTAQMLEERRVHDAAIVDNQARTAIAYQNMLQDKPLRALQAQAELLRIKKMARDEAMVNIAQLTQDHEATINGLFAKNKNFETINQWEQYKTQWAGAVASGVPFDAAKFNENFQKMVTHYGAPEQDKSGVYDPQAEALLYERFGKDSPVAKTYSYTLNPAIAPNASEIRMGILMANEKDLPSALSVARSIFPEEKVIETMVGRSRRINLEREIEMINQSLSGLAQYGNQPTTPPGEKKVIRDEMAALRKRADEKKAQYESLISGAPIPEPIAAPEEQKSSLFPDRTIPPTTAAKVVEISEDPKSPYQIRVENDPVTGIPQELMTSGESRQDRINLAEPRIIENIGKYVNDPFDYGVMAAKAKEKKLNYRDDKAAVFRMFEEQLNKAAPGKIGFSPTGEDSFMSLAVERNRPYVFMDLGTSIDSGDVGGLSTLRSDIPVRFGFEPGDSEDDFKKAFSAYLTMAVARGWNKAEAANKLFADFLALYAIDGMNGEINFTPKKNPNQEKEDSTSEILVPF